MKQTAVEWLVEQLNEKIDFIPLDKWDMIRDIIQQAKEMEKQQVINAFISGEHQQGYQAEAETYYNETFNANEK